MPKPKLTIVHICGHYSVPGKTECCEFMWSNGRECRTCYMEACHRRGMRAKDRGRMRTNDGSPIIRRLGMPEPKRVVCPKCDGQGSGPYHPTDTVVCPACNGDCFVPDHPPDAGQKVFSEWSDVPPYGHKTWLDAAIAGYGYGLARDCDREHGRNMARAELAELRAKADKWDRATTLLAKQHEKNVRLVDDYLKNERPFNDA